MIERAVTVVKAVVNICLRQVARKEALPGPEIKSVIICGRLKPLTPVLPANRVIFHRKRGKRTTRKQMGILKIKYVIDRMWKTRLLRTLGNASPLILPNLILNRIIRGDTHLRQVSVQERQTG